MNLLGVVDFLGCLYVLNGAEKLSYSLWLNILLNITYGQLSVFFYLLLHQCNY